MFANRWQCPFCYTLFRWSWPQSDDSKGQWEHGRFPIANFDDTKKDFWKNVFFHLACRARFALDFSVAPNPSTSSLELRDRLLQTTPVDLNLNLWVNTTHYVCFMWNSSLTFPKDDSDVYPCSNPSSSFYKQRERGPRRGNGMPTVTRPVGSRTRPRPSFCYLTLLSRRQIPFTSQGSRGNAFLYTWVKRIGFKDREICFRSGLCHLASCVTPELIIHFSEL